MMQPDYTERDCPALRDGIRDHGLQWPIRVQRGTRWLLDGRHRLKACIEEGVPLKVEEVDIADEDVPIYTRCEAAKRPGLSPTRRALVALALLPEFERRARVRQELGAKLCQGDESGKAAALAASLTGACARYVQDLVALRRDHKPIFERVERGDLDLQAGKRERDGNGQRGGAGASRKPLHVPLVVVRGWMGPNEHGGRGIPRRELKEMPFRGDNGKRTVILAFDSDAMTNPKVHDALRELFDFLESRGADVWVMYLPPGAESSKVGLDDFLAAPHSLQDALNCCEAELRPLGNGPALLSFAELLALPPLPWTLKGLLPAGGVTVLYGQYASFKSFVLLDWLACVASGAPDWFGVPIERRGPCAYVYSEGLAGAGQRVQGVRLARHRRDDTPLFVRPTAVDITSPRAVACFIDMMRSGLAGQCPAIVAIDTLSRNMPGKDANAPADMNAFVAGCDAIRRAFGCQVIVVHHPIKAKGDPRSALDLSNSADTIIKAERRSGDELGTTLTIEKQKDGDHGAHALSDYAERRTA